MPGLLLGLLLGLAPRPAAAQATPPWRLVDGGEEVAWTPPAPGVAPAAAASLALAHLQRQGFFGARVDSVQGSTLYVTRGAAARVTAVELVGAQHLDATLLQRELSTRPGEPFRAEGLDADLAALAERYGRAGRPLAQIRPELVMEEEGVRVRVVIEEGGTVRLRGVELVGARQTRPSFAVHAAGLAVGAEIVRFDPEAVRRDLLATGIFDMVGEPQLVVVDSGAVVRVPVREGPPGSFDLVLGYLPDGGAGGGGAVVGTGRIELRNLFGGGRSLRLSLVRDPGLTASVDVRASDPYLFGLPLRVEGRFEGYGQDSTFARQRYRVEAGYRVVPGLELTAGATRESVQPGPAGARPAVGDPTGRPRIAASDAAFAGFGLRYARVDDPVAPHRGLVVDVAAERGRRRRTVPDSVATPATVTQQRLFATLRVYVPTLRRQTFVTGGDASVLLSGRTAADGVDEGDLFRFGGARSLRGYDENRFAGDAVGRLVAEYRYALDPTSFAFAFFDLGYVGRPATPDGPAARDVRPGYGVGIQYRTPLGLATLTYALNPEIGFAGGKVHVGLAFGL